MATVSDLVGVSFQIFEMVWFLPFKKGKHKYLYWEFPSYGGQQAIRIDYAHCFMNKRIKTKTLSVDPKELNDIASDILIL